MHTLHVVRRYDAVIDKALREMQPAPDLATELRQAQAETVSSREFIAVVSGFVVTLLVVVIAFVGGWMLSK